MISTPDLQAYTHTITSSEETYGFHLSTVSLLLESETELRIYFTLEEGSSVEDYLFTLPETEKTLEVKYSEDKQKYYVVIPHILANHLQDMYTVKVLTADGQTEIVDIHYGPFSYAYYVISTGYLGEEWSNLLKAMYYYNQAALEYVANK